MDGYRACAIEKLNNACENNRLPENCEGLTEAYALP